MSSFNYPGPGLGNVASYQIAPIPWVSASIAVPASGSAPVEVNFYNVASLVNIYNNGPSTIKVGFSALGAAGTNYFAVAASGSYEGRFRVSRLYMVSSNATGSTANVLAGLTTIDGIHLPTNWSGSAGIG